MRIGKTEQLDQIISILIEEIGRPFKSCVVTNERGLIVAGKAKDGSVSERLAAMVSLLSDTSRRVNENLGYDHPRITTIKGSGVSIAVHEFQVQDRWFRIGAELDDGKFLFYRRVEDKKVWQSLEKTADKVRNVLEER
jgi:predicted regulator of Ras-like GTPase activity (Roadblock/LC7/MglB family)